MAAMCPIFQYSFPMFIIPLEVEFEPPLTAKEILASLPSDTLVEYASSRSILRNIMRRTAELLSCDAQADGKGQYKNVHSISSLYDPGSVHFQVKASWVAYVSLTPEPYVNASSPRIVIYLSAWYNNRTCIDKNNIKNKDVVTKWILSNKELRWDDDGNISVGYEGKAGPFLTWRDPEPFPIKYVGIATAINAIGTWRIRELKEEANTPISRITSNQRTRLSFAAAVIGAPPIIVLDECTAYQNSSVQRVMYFILYHLRKQGHAIILSASDVESHLLIMNKLAFMLDGMIYDVDTIENMLTRHSEEGYTVVVHLKEKVVVQNFIEMFKLYFDYFSINDSTEVFVNVQVREDMDWDEIFQRMENLMKETSMCTRTSLLPYGSNDASLVPRSMFMIDL